MENYWKNNWKIIAIILSIIFTQFLGNNVNALELTTEVEATGTTFPITNLDCFYADGTNTSRLLNCINPNSSGSNIVRLRPSQKISTIEGYYYRTFLVIKTTGDFNEILYRIDTNNDNWSIVSWNLITSDSVSLRGVVTGSTGATTLLDFGLGDSRYAKFFEVTLKAKHTGDYYYSLGDSNNFFVYSPVPTGNQNVYVGISPIEEFRPYSQTAQAEQKTEEATEEGQSNSDQAQSDNEGATSSLLDVAGGIISAFGTSSSNCNFNMDLGNVDFGNINLCSGKPSEFSPIIDTVVVLMLIPIIFMTSISLVHQFINLTKFAQGGD